jgi:hypothetical protein
MKTNRDRQDLVGTKEEEERIRKRGSKEKWGGDEK